ncbi:hypothetical protein E3Q16_01930 [Wallemia mellicola]|uniref:Septin-type G domain-containing protein n=1 Tax=Wallemia mellicola TaxID=1708541 RepID=A0AB74KIJ9_9BASI|nr:hypothetical protein E3Q24_01957 [Wallemia mellicola]TIC05631.1 hypothetical protein E3Q16_01930 [Wallemia mellicola]TIC23774.1 hypothetical protein E3Q12_01841 [Wallemia mellicola]TIC67830.1 hypothetical protein E3Q03_01811 [Wallemia mellicola]
MVSFLQSCRNSFRKEKRNTVHLDNVKASPSLPDLGETLGKPSRFADEIAQSVQGLDFKRDDFSPNHLQVPQNLNVRLSTVSDNTRRFTKPNSLTSRNARRRKTPRSLNVMVAGGIRTGKTSLLRLILDTVKLSPTSNITQRTEATISFTNKHQPKQPLYQMSFDVGGDVNSDRTMLTLTDTPGLNYQDSQQLGENTDMIIKHIEHLYTQTLEEESRVNRSNSSQALDRHIHVCVYMIDPARLIESHNGSLTLQPIELQTIISLAKRVNILPVIAHADSLTDNTLRLAKDGILSDLANIGFKFEILGLNERASTPDSNAHLSDLDDDHNNSTKLIKIRHRAKSATPSVASTDNSHMTNLDPVPYAIVIPERFDKPSTTRNFRWGVVDVLDNQHTDYNALYDVLFGNNSDSLRIRTRETLYESFRREALISRQKDADSGPKNLSSIRNSNIYKKRQTSFN